VLFVGSHRRDFATLRAVIEQLRRRAPAVRFVLVTDPDSGRELATYPNVSLRRNLSESDLIRLYRESSLVVQPLQDSTANNTILEALACGAPLVATDVGATRDYVNGGCAILTPPGDATSMANAVVELTEDAEKRRRMGEAARRQARTFAWPHVAAQLDALYRSIS
jgi:glycosyltransferase involved in cell wall biosynthesis